MWLTDETGSVLLLQRRSEHKDTHPGMWDVSCAGHITGADGSVETAVRELEEELGVALSESELRAAHICTLPSLATGQTASHGAFDCREYQDLYLVRMRSLDVGSLTLGSDEVAGAEVRAADEVLSAWEERRGGYVPRTSAYARVIREALAGSGM